MSAHNELGRKGEDAAMEYLIGLGYKILKRNLICNGCEIDIIAQNEDFIVFIEVKTRTSTYWQHPEDAVSKSKMKRMVQAADFYLNENDIDLPARFDIIAIIPEHGSFTINHIDDAFLAPIN